MSEPIFTSAGDGEQYRRVAPAEVPDGDQLDSREIDSAQGAPEAT